MGARYLSRRAAGLLQDAPPPDARRFSPEPFAPESPPQHDRPLPVQQRRLSPEVAGFDEREPDVKAIRRRWAEMRAQRDNYVNPTEWWSNEFWDAYDVALRHELRRRHPPERAPTHRPWPLHGASRERVAGRQELPRAADRPLRRRGYALPENPIADPTAYVPWD
eukprot:Hpha_TRINITY_DN9543_c0_g1::TRINITY_DN9543_c0_g1_i2::g.114934::m.114934